jgi:hypothetical protein
MDIKTESESENITNLSWVYCTMYDNAESIAFASVVKIEHIEFLLLPTFEFYLNFVEVAFQLFSYFLTDSR